MNDNSKADKLYDRVMNVVEESKRLVHSPHVSDMEHIQTEVQKLCVEINELPVEQRVGYADKFQHLFDALTDLEKTLHEKRDEIEKMLSGTDQHKKATSAYTKTSYIDKKPKE